MTSVLPKLMHKMDMSQTAQPFGSKVKLGSVMSHVRVTAMPGDLPADDHFIGLEDIASESGQIINTSRVSDVRSRVFQFQIGDVLYGRLRPYLKKAAVTDFSGSASGEVIVIRCSENILPRYLKTVLLSEDFTNFVNARVKGDRPRTSFELIASYQLELPSIESQTEICAHDDRIANAVAKLRDALNALEYSSALLISAMRIKLIWNAFKDTKVTSFLELVEDISYGTTRKSSYTTIGAPVLRIPNITSSCEIDSSDLKFSALNRKEMERYRLKAGDLLMIRSNGTLSLVGRAAKVDQKHENYTFAGYLLRLRPRKIVLSDFLLELVRSTPFQRMVEAAAKSSTGINNLSAGRLASFPVPLLPIERQKRIISILSRAQMAINASIENVRQTFIDAEKLHKTARGAWLGQAMVSRGADSIRSEGQEAISSPDFDEKDLQMDKDIEALILKSLDSMQFRSASFENLAKDVQTDYERLRDGVFKLLAKSPPELIQVFDKTSRSIILKRPE